MTRAAIGLRSERVSVTWANSGCPLSASMTAATPSCRPDPQVVALGDVVGEHHPGVLADPGQHGEQHVALERLRLVDDDERVVQRAAADVGERQHLEHAAVDDLLDHLAARPARRACRRPPGAHGPIFSASLPGR